MNRKKFACGAAIVLALAALCTGCGGEDGMKDRPLRELPAEYRYEVEKQTYRVGYTDSEGAEIELYGELYEPQGEGKFPAVILSHGFNGHFSDFTAECNRFAARGYVCYAFDFCGAQASGLSTGRGPADYTPFTMKEDLKAAVKRIQKRKNVDATQVFLFGGSQGGFVTALTAADLKKDVAAIAMYFPALNIPDDWRGKPEQDTPLMGYSIGAKFIRSVQDLDPYAVIGNFAGDVCIVWGDQDELVRKTYIDRAVETYGAARTDLTVIPGAGHGFGGEALETAIGKVLSFLEAHTFA